MIRNNPVLKKRILQILPVLILAFAAIASMFRYVTGELIFVFTDIASDTVTQQYPKYLYLARMIREGLAAGTYNFSDGLGAGQGTIVLSLFNWISFFGEEHVAYLIAVNQILTVFFSGLFFYGFLREKQTPRWFATVLSLGYAFCGHILIRGSWESYPKEVLLVGLWLYAFERWFQKKDFRWLPLATALFYFTLGSPYRLILYAVIFPVYAGFRYVTERDIKMKSVLLVFGILLAVLAVWLFLTDFAIVRTVKGLLSSQRATTVMQETDWSLSAFLPDIGIWTTIFARTVGTTILNISFGYAGDDNFLEDPTFYCGLAVLLLLPIAFLQLKAKRKVWYAFAYAAAAVYCFCRPIRILANGFSGDTFKLSSFWIILLMLLTVSNIDWPALTAGRKKWLYLGVLLLTEAGLQYCLYRLVQSVEGAVYTWKGSAVFLAVEGVVLLLVIVTGRAARVFQGFFVAAAAAEVLWMSWPVYYERLNVQADVFADDTAGALDMIASQDDSFYRVDKQYFTVAHNDSFAQGYYGTASYIGGTGIPENVLKFYTDLGLHDGINLRSIYAPSAYNQVDTLLGVKYALARDYSGISNYGYEQIGETGSVQIFENTCAVPMGFVYYETISREEFEALSYYERQTALMEACLTDADTGVESISQESIDRIKSISALVDEYQIKYEYSTKSWAFEFEPNTEDEVLLVTIKFTDNSGETAVLKYRSEDGADYGERITGLYSAEGNIFEITQAGVYSLWFDAEAGAEGLKIAKVPKSVYYALWEENTARQQAGRVILSETRSDYMRGTFTAEQAGILYLPIVNNGWQVCIDGVGQNIMTVNDAFIGVIVTAGTHELELSYPTRSLWRGYKKRVKIYGACLAVILFGSFYRGRSHKKRLRGSGPRKRETAA